ncbi:PI-PLC domain-containing protein [Photobacterium leiognathi]|uniref:hypothetical protein n=1 Tax=Photobacterium leiognathi TaxID=553611 RepID=UPI0029820AE6|nr:hypothetical protein [Photobacterium leiognathi]
MEIIAHRGYWIDKAEKNTFTAFKRAIDNNFGIETDLRDYDGEIVISHDIPTQNNRTLDDFLNLVSENKEIILALNIKSDGLQDLLLRNDAIKEIRHFYFDMSIPDCLIFSKKNMTYFSRVSDIEPTALLYLESDGVWLDNFTDDELDLVELDKVLSDGKKVALVSPELHGYCYESYWAKLKQYVLERKSSKNILICTDFPMQAKDYFNV